MWGSMSWSYLRLRCVPASPSLPDDDESDGEPALMPLRRSSRRNRLAVVIATDLASSRPRAEVRRGPQASRRRGLRAQEL